MTTTQLYLFNFFYLVLSVVVAILTRATPRRIAGAMAGGVAAGVVALGSIALGEKVGWWHFVFTWGPYFLTVMLIGFPLMGFIFLITWRIARRFGWRRAGRCLGLGGGHRAAAELFVHEAVPGMGQLRAGGRPDPRDLRKLCYHGARGARRDATGLRTGRRGPAGARPWESS